MLNQRSFPADACFTRQQKSRSEPESIRAMGIRNFLVLLTLLSASQGYAQPLPHLRVTAVSAYDQGETSDSRDFAIDVLRQTCDPTATPPVAEAFHDTLLGITVINSTNVIARLKRIRFRIPRIAGKRRYRSRFAALASIGEVAPGSSAEFLAFFAHAAGGNKYLPGSSEPISELTGIRNIRIFLTGVNALGKRVRLTAKTSLVFRDVDRCI